MTYNVRPVMRNLLISLLKSFSITSRDQLRPILSRNPSYLNAHWIESKPFSFCRSKQWTWLILIRRSSRNSIEQTNPEKDNRHTQQIMNLATQLAVKEHLKQYLIQKFPTHSRRDGTITMIVLQCTELHFLSKNYSLSSQHE